MARKFSTYSHTVKDLKIVIRFEAEELNDQGQVLDNDFVLAFQEHFNGLGISPDAVLESTAQMVHAYFEQKLHEDPANVYTNLMGDEYPRVRLTFVEVQGTYTATYGD